MLFRCLALFIAVSFATFQIPADEAADVKKATVIDEKTLPKVLLPLAEKGDAVAQCLLARCFYNGININRDFDQAFLWFSRSAEQGYSRGQNGLAMCYMNGQGVEKDETKAVELMQRAVDQGSPIAQHNLGRWYQQGLGVAKNSEESVRLFRLAAAQGYPLAMNALGRCYFYGVGVEKNLTEAVGWYKKSAELENTDAQYDLGRCYETGSGAAKDEKEAVRWIFKAANQGHAASERTLGCFYLQGFGLSKNSEEAVKWFRKAAEKGDSCAQRNMGLCYEHGDGVTPDAKEAANWYRLSAEQGFVPAQNCLGVCYFRGIGVKKDMREAAQWFRKAAEQGFAPAQYALGVCYLHGNGVDRDANEATLWIQKAADQGIVEAKKKLSISSDATALFWAATLPVLLLLCLFYWVDTRREPLSVLLPCLFLGGISVIPPYFIESLFMKCDLFGGVAANMGLKAALVGLTEESWKFAALFLFVWKHKEFDQYYDGIVYAVFVSLGFAMVENIGYVFQHGHETASLRAVLTVPAHCCFGVLMGYYLSFAKFSANDKEQTRWYLTLSLALPVLMHALYDFICFCGEAAVDMPPNSEEKKLANGLEPFFMFLIIYLWYTGTRRTFWLIEKDWDVLSSPQHPDQNRLYTIAIQHRFLNMGILFGIVYAILSGFIYAFSQRPDPEATEINHALTTFIIVVPYISFLMWLTPILYRLKQSLDQSGGLTVFYWLSSCLTIPFLNIILPVLISHEVSKFLSNTGCEVGFLGVDLNQFTRDQAENDLGSADEWGVIVGSIASER